MERTLAFKAKRIQEPLSKELNDFLNPQYDPSTQTAEWEETGIQLAGFTQSPGVCVQTHCYPGGYYTNDDSRDTTDTDFVW